MEVLIVVTLLSILFLLLALKITFKVLPAIIGLSFTIILALFQVIGFILILPVIGMIFFVIDIMIISVIVGLIKVLVSMKGVK